MREMFIEKGFNDFLTKPIDIVKLDDMLERWISKEKRGERKEIREEKKLILLVDESPANLRLGMSALEENYNVITAPSAEKALRLLENSSPDVILMNGNMPLPRDLPVIFITEPFDPLALVMDIENYLKGASK